MRTMDLDSSRYILVPRSLRDSVANSAAKKVGDLESVLSAKLATDLVPMLVMSKDCGRNVC
jgi:hypothetical protein